ncbi:MAG: hypothetical protein WA373_05160 [Burkholderiales bacterium]
MRICLTIVLLALGLAQAVAQEAGFAIRRTEVKKEPFSDAATVGTLPEKSRVKVLRREGGWMQVESTVASGWVRMLSVRMGTGAEQPGGDSGVKSLFNIARTGSSGTAVATGVRGLDKEQIRNAKPNPAELQKLAGFSAARPDAERFAAGDPKLKKQAIEYFPAPATPATPQSR